MVSNEGEGRRRNIGHEKTWYVPDSFYPDYLFLLDFTCDETIIMKMT